MSTQKLKNWCKTTAGIALVLSGFSSYAAEPQQCKKVTLSDPGWSDIGATNGVVTTLLEGLGYQTEVYLLGVPVGFKSLKSGEVDVFMGNWMPAQKNYAEKYQQDIDIIRTNLSGVKFTLAVPNYVYDAGVHDFKDLNRFADQFRSRIYGISAGSPANDNIKKMIETNDFGLKDWRIVESGEQAMLSEVNRAFRRNQFIVFLGWEPHPMNVNFDIRYLSGGDKYFGPDYGSATIRTVTRTGYSQECSNVGKLLSNLSFTVGMENELINQTNKDGIKPKQAARDWIRQHPETLNQWLKGVTTFSGKDALPAMKQALKI
ncbi:choline ABC transporter substrate-binding protein [Vibrio mangrovi]|uniref:Choline ABC transporter substrate-binding protein n=1 Tax=Vibrio mangrovi TaxID=474394 RepID=A0A1Y6ISL9_9VIBR|nr:choline ABC transporter substrate-binding protein [Vibrio mangrovi]MDW6001352.1 choline ABC transporter substrate-binding protein [Vibrio mangrovi]SMS00626.1 Glycine betaine-binding protein OpuAC precursor [Vibrio mangrovi]